MSDIQAELDNAVAALIDQNLSPDELLASIGVEALKAGAPPAQKEAVADLAVTLTAVPAAARGARSMDLAPMAPQAAKASAAAVDVGLLEWFGQGLLDSFEMALYKLTCNFEGLEDDVRKALELAFTQGEKALAAALAGVFAVQLGWAAGLAAVVALYLAKQVLSGAQDQACKLWKERIDAKG